jgi:hypothetical protein
MLRKGIVTEVNTSLRTARVSFQDLNNTVTADIPYARHVSIEVNDRVAVMFFSANLSDGLIVAVY